MLLVKHNAERQPLSVAEGTWTQLVTHITLGKDYAF